MKPHTITKKLVLLTCHEVLEVLFGEEFIELSINEMIDLKFTENNTLILLKNDRTLNLKIKEIIIK